MKGITLKPWWAAAIATLGKDCENRTWAPYPSVRGQRIAIHAGALAPVGWACGERRKEMLCRMFDSYHTDRDNGDHWITESTVDSMIDEMQSSAIIATAVISGWWCQLPGTPVMYFDYRGGTMVHVHLSGFHGFVKPSRWWIPDHYGWHLTDIRVIEPIPCKGKLGLWEVPADIVERINGSA